MSSGAANTQTDTSQNLINHINSHNDPLVQSFQDQQDETAAAISQVAKLSLSLRSRGSKGEDVTEVQDELAAVTANLCRLQQELITDPDTTTSRDGFQDNFRSSMDTIMVTLSGMEAALVDDRPVSNTLSDTKQHLHDEQTMLESLISTADSARLPPTPPSEEESHPSSKSKPGSHIPSHPTPRITIDTSVASNASHAQSHSQPGHLAPAATSQEILTPAGAQIPDMAPIDRVETIDEEDDGALSSNDALYAAVTDNDHDTLASLLSYGLDPAAWYGELQRTPLHQAAHLNHTDCLQTLLSHGASMETQDAKGDTALHLAAWAGNAETISLLLSHGADVDWLSGGDGYSPLWCAVSSRHTRCAKLLVRNGAQINLRASSRNHKNNTGSNADGSAAAAGLTPLHQAAVTAQPVMCELLISHGAKVDCEADDRCTPLHYAAAAGSIACAAVLLAAGAQIEAAQIHGLTAVHWAAHKGHVEVLEVLLDHGAKLDPVSSEGAATPLHLAACRGHTDVACVLLERAKGRNRRVASWAGLVGTPAQMARERGFEDLARILEM